MPDSAPLSPRIRRLCLLASTLLWWSALAWGIFPFAWIALTPLLWATRDLTPRQAAFYGWKGGVLSFWLINWWIVPTIMRGAPLIGQSPFMGVVLAIVAVSGVAIIHALQVLAAVWTWRRIERGWLAALAFAFVWTLGEWVRTQTAMAHAWGALAFSQWRDLPLLQLVWWGGQHALTALCVWCSAMIALAFWQRETRRKYLHLAWPLGALLIAHGCGAWRLHGATSTRMMPILVTQTDVSGLDKALGRESSAAQVSRLTDEALKALEGTKLPRPQLMIWPEGTVNVRKIGDGLSGTDALRMQMLVRESGVPLLAGTGVLQSVEGRELYRNDALLMDASGNFARRGKTRPVPFGERALFGEIVPFLNSLAPTPPVEIAPYEGPLHLQTPSGRLQIGTAICFESAFPEPALDNTRRGDLLAIVTNDKWFQSTEAPREHAAMAIVRAVENGAATVQAANGGQSLAVDRFGRRARVLWTNGGFDGNGWMKFGEKGAVLFAVPLP